VEGSHYKKIQRDFLISDQIFNANEAKLVNSQKVLVYDKLCKRPFLCCLFFVLIFWEISDTCRLGCSSKMKTNVSHTSNVFILKDYYAEDCEAHEKASGSL
jgi:hypothetical protein